MNSPHYNDIDPTWHLPDPSAQPEFYADVATKRLLAWVIDTVLTGALVLLILPFTAFTGIFFLPLLFLMVNFAYRVITLANGSATLGMRLMAIEFRTNSGARFSLSDAVLHTLGFAFSMSMMPLQIVSIVLMLTTARRLIATVPMA